MLIDKLRADLVVAQKKLGVATNELKLISDQIEQWEQRLENNCFDSLEDAQFELTEQILEVASEACECSYCCGESEYTREFMVNGVHYCGTLKIEYNRHDKRYYFVDTYKWSAFKVDQIHYCAI